MAELYKYKGHAPVEYAKMACDTLMRKFKPEVLPPEGHFHYHQGVFLSGMEKTYRLTGDENYFRYIKAWIDSLIDENGQIKHFDSGQLDDIQPGILLFELYKKTKDIRYKTALDTLMDFLRKFPKNKEGGYWHKEKNSEQMWLDGLYMAGPLIAQYGAEFHEAVCFDICSFQALLMEQKTRDPKTGLLYHAWDSVRERPWANVFTGCSPEFWGRSVGWVPVAILDELEVMPDTYEKRSELIRMVTELLKSVIAVQDISGMWYQVLNKGNQPGNWLETSCTCLFVAAICKAVRLGFLDTAYMVYAQKGFEAVIDRLEYRGLDIIIGNICVGTGVGNYEFYCNRPTSENDLHGTGAFLLMCTEMQEVADWKGRMYEIQ